MKAAFHTRYGPPEVVQVKEVEKPIPKDNDVLIKVFASTVNRTDCGIRSAEYFISRFFSGLLRPKQQTLGCEFAGDIEDTGSLVSTFKKGDRVFGYNDTKFGGHAEYLVNSEHDAVEHIPAGLSYEQAAAITEGAHYAWGNIKAAKVLEGHQVMVYGATGAIGSSAVQLLKYIGAEVTAICNTQNVALVHSLGADHVIDYQTQDFTNTNQTFDFIFDAVGKSSFAACKPLLKEKGIYISTELGKHSANVFLALVTPLFGGKKVLFPLPSISKEVVRFLKTVIEEGKFRPVIDRTYSLDEIVEAYKYVETGQKTGNVVIKIRE